MYIEREVIYRKRVVIYIWRGRGRLCIYGEVEGGYIYSGRGRLCKEVDKYSCKVVVDLFMFILLS